MFYCLLILPFIILLCYLFSAFAISLLNFFPILSEPIRAIAIKEEMDAATPNSPHFQKLNVDSRCLSLHSDENRSSRLVETGAKSPHQEPQLTPLVPMAKKYPKSCDHTQNTTTAVPEKSASERYSKTNLTGISGTATYLYNSSSDLPLSQAFSTAVGTTQPSNYPHHIFSGFPSEKPQPYPTAQLSSYQLSFPPKVSNPPIRSQRSDDQNLTHASSMTSLHGLSYHQAYHQQSHVRSSASSASNSPGRPKATDTF